MPGFKELIKESGVDNLNRLIEEDDSKYLVFTRLTSQWVLCVSDGLEVWRLEWDEEEMEAHRDLAGISTSPIMMTRIKNAFTSGDLSVTPSGNKVTLTAGTGPSGVIFDLYEAKAAERKAEIQTVLFRLASDVQRLDTELTAANQTIEKLKAQKGGGAARGGGNAFMDLGPKKGVNPAKMKPKKTGMSVVNPTSKKRKAPSGVVFD